jgi:hypothetical protein
VLARVAVAFLVGMSAVPAIADGPLPSLDSSELAQGPYSLMHMMLQKTLFRINVATIDVRVDQQVQSRLAGLVRGQAYSEGVAQQLASAAIGAERAVVQMQFKRDVSLNRWIGVVRENLEQARVAGLIDVSLEKRVGQALPEWFAALHERGYEKGDRLIYAVGRDSLRTVVVSTTGQVFVDRLEREQGTRRVVLASYFAPGSDFREPLLRSLWETRR